MGLGVILECVAVRKNSRAERWIRGDVFTNPKETGFGVVSGKHVQNIGGRAAGSVIDGEPDSALLSLKVG